MTGYHLFKTLTGMMLQQGKASISMHISSDFIEASVKLRHIDSASTDNTVAWWAWNSLHSR